MSSGADVAAAIKHGRQLCRAGRFSEAEAAWRACLRDAFAQGNHAAMFVLSKNLGDVCASQDEAIEFYEYALEVATVCGVLRDPLLRSSIASVAVAMQNLDDCIDVCTSCGDVDVRLVRPSDTKNALASVCFRCYEDAHLVKTSPHTPKAIVLAACATCALDFPQDALKLDVDDQMYCNPCFDAYYADEGNDPAWNDEDDEYEEDDEDDGMLCAGCLDADGTVAGGNGLVYCSDCFAVSVTIPSSATTTQSGQVSPRHEEDKLPTIPSAPSQRVEEPSDQLDNEPIPDVLPSPAPQSAAPTPKKYTKAFLLSLRNSGTTAPVGLEKSPVYIHAAQKREIGGPLRAKTPPTPPAAPANSPADQVPVVGHSKAMTSAAFAHHVFGLDTAMLEKVRGVLVGGPVDEQCERN